MTTGSLMGYPQTSSAVVGNTDGGFIYDGRFGNIYGLDTTDGAQSGIRKWDAWPQGLERRARSIGDLGVAGLNSQITSLYAAQQLVIYNASLLMGFTMADMSHTSDFSVNGSLGNSGPLVILPPGVLCSFLDAYGRDIVVSKTLTSGATTGGQEINCIQWGNKFNQVSNLTENFAVVGAIPDGSGRNAYALGFSTLPTTAVMHLYRIGPVLGGNGIQATVATLLPAQIDATWTNVTSVFGITVDQTDGNVILGFATTDAVTNQGRLVKLNVTTGAVMWSTAVAGNPGGINYANTEDMGRNVITAGTLYYIGTGTTILFTINTLTGAATSQTFDDGALDVLHGHQMSEDVSGSIIWYGGWVEGATVPAYIGNYCGTLGHHTGSHMGWRFWPNTPFPPPVYAPPSTSRKRAWSFVLDGHTFYALDLGQQGTWVYDQSTNQWAQFITSGYTQWNFANGVMWGQRIVAGDLITTDVWEMQPSALFDNGATEILHTVTGGIATRSRTYHSVDSFILACSVGQLEDGGAGANVTLSFSDDQGQTFTALDTITLTESNFSGEIAWRSLGSFAAPGRVFRIVDTGGFLRIDGADVGLDGFDPASNPAEPGS